MIIKNIALAGHAGTGKTTLLEALLYQGGCVERMGSVAAGTTVSDAAPEEIKRHSSVYTATGSIMLDGQKINLLDTPGICRRHGAGHLCGGLRNDYRIRKIRRSGGHEKGIPCSRGQATNVCGHKAGR